MKKIVFALVLVLTMGLCANAQRDSFFNDWDNEDILRSDILPDLPNAHYLENDYNLPLGSGLLILTALGAGYALSRRKH